MAEHKLDLNRATEDQLAALPGVDRELALRIVTHRKHHGPFRSLAELDVFRPVPADADQSLRSCGFLEEAPAAAGRVAAGEGALALSTEAWEDGGRIPEKYTRDGENLSPPLAWQNAPAETRSFAIIMEDPDAPTGRFDHWGVYGIAAERDRFPEGATKGAPTERLGQVRNDFGNPHYDGPEPPPGHGPHRYRLRLMALEVPTLSLPDRPAVEDLRSAAEGHVLAQAEITGIYER